MWCVTGGPNCDKLSSKMWDVSCGRGMCVPPTWPLCVWTVNHRWFTGVIQRLFTHKWKLSGNQNSLQVGTSHSWVQRLKCCEVNHQSVYDNFKKMGGMGGGSAVTLSGTERGWWRRPRRLFKTRLHILQQQTAACLFYHMNGQLGGHFCSAWHQFLSPN